MKLSESPWLTRLNRFILHTPSPCPCFFSSQLKNLAVLEGNSFLKGRGSSREKTHTKVKNGYQHLKAMDEAMPSKQGFQRF